MRTGIILQLATLLLLFLGTPNEGLFFSYPKNALVKFFQSLHQKKEVKKPQNIHHYHLHYYPVHAQIWASPVKAPNKLELEKLHSNYLESLGWSHTEYNIVPEVNIYRPPPSEDPWSEYSVTPPSSWEDYAPEQTVHFERQEKELPKAGIIVQVPLHQTIMVQQPATKKEKPETHPLTAFFQKLRRIKNSIFSIQDGSDESDSSKPETSVNDKFTDFVVHLKPEISRKI